LGACHPESRASLHNNRNCLASVCVSTKQREKGKNAHSSKDMSDRSAKEPSYYGLRLLNLPVTLFTSPFLLFPPFNTSSRPRLSSVSSPPACRGRQGRPHSAGVSRVWRENRRTNLFSHACLSVMDVDLAPSEADPAAAAAREQGTSSASAQPSSSTGVPSSSAAFYPIGMHSWFSYPLCLFVLRLRGSGLLSCCVMSVVYVRAGKKNRSRSTAEACSCAFRLG
jgi:hypothetical protein